MAYKIEYTPESAYRYPQAEKRRTIKPGKFVFLLFLIAAAAWIRFRGIPDILIPGDAVVTRAAASDFMEHVKTGMSVGEAVTVFCQQIIDGAGV